MPKIYGFIHQLPTEADWIFGDGSIDTEILQADGQWDAFLPPDELQAALGYETYACGPFGTLHAVETLSDLYSPRYLAKMVHCDLNHGSSPQDVAEYIRTNGTCDDSSWPILPTIDSFDVFYQAPPIALSIEAERFTGNYAFQHDYVPNDPVSMKQALMYSPLGMSVYGWQQDPATGLYKAIEGQDNHWVTLYGYDDVSWHVFDSYDLTHKRVEIAHRPLTVKRYHIAISQQTTSFFQKAITIFNAFLAKYMPQPSGAPANNLLNAMCLAIQKHEGWNLLPPSRSVRNNSPGNVRFSPVGYLPIYEPVGKDADNFAIFKDYATGFLYLKNLILEKAQKLPSDNLFDFFNVYAPKSDGNDPIAYAEAVGVSMNVNPATFRMQAVIS